MGHVAIIRSLYNDNTTLNYFISIKKTIQEETLIETSVA